MFKEKINQEKIENCLRINSKREIMLHPKRELRKPRVTAQLQAPSPLSTTQNDAPPQQ
jgi:hypothetical protein